jgi:hypothetical protein
VNKLRWGKFYWSDWADDPALALCSLAAQGLWMRLLCIAAQGAPYGHVNIGGKSPTVEMLAKLVRAKPPFVARLIAELERHGVASRDASGCLVSIRQESDGKLAGIRAAAAKSRWNKELGNGLHKQKTDFASTESTETQESRIPPVAPQRGVRGRAAENGARKKKPSLNAGVDILQEEHVGDAVTVPRSDGAPVVRFVARAIGRPH